MNIYTILAVIVFCTYMVFVGCCIIVNYLKRRRFRKYVENMQIPF